VKLKPLLPGKILLVTPHTAAIDCHTGWQDDRQTQEGNLQVQLLLLLLWHSASSAAGAAGAGAAAAGFDSLWKSLSEWLNSTTPTSPR
jgi:hypothetical protein